MASGAQGLSDPLRLDAAAESERIVGALREGLAGFKRKGVVVGVSGGIDSSVVAALCARAVGKERVVALLMPEAESSPESTCLGQRLAETLGVRYIVEDITAALEGAGCYRRRDEAIRSVFPGLQPGYRSKIVLPNLLERDQYSLFSLLLQSPGGEMHRVRLSLEAYLGIVAATNFKQRVRKMMEYYYADRLNYAVAGTPNRLEYELGFFVKNGDGAADLKPIAHLYKSQVYQLAAHLGVPDEIQRRPPTTDTYSLEQSQEEFYFAMPLATMDLCLYGKDHGLSPAQIAPLTGLGEEQVTRAYASIESKRRMTRYLRSAPLIFA